MYQYYTVEECSKLVKELHIPWKYIEECTGIRRYTITNAKNRLTDLNAKKRACVLCTVAIRSYMESGVATSDERRLFENFESAKAEDKEWGSWEERMEKKSKPKYMTEEAYKEWREEMNE